MTQPDTTPPDFDCLCAGIVVADHVCHPIDHLPAPGELVTTARMELSIGGCASNVACDLAKLGLRSGIVGVVGQDVFGRFVRDALEDAGVRCDFLSESSTHQTSGSMVINARGEDRRFIHAVGANAAFTGREVSPDLIATCQILYLGGYCLSDSLDPGNVAEMFQAARRAGVTTLLDVVIPDARDYWPRIEAVLPWTDVFLPNNDEGRLITKQEDPWRQAEQFRAAGAKTVIVTCGSEGAVLIDGDERLRSACYPVEFVDGTGSGDAFVAGLIYGLSRNAELVDCLRYGSALGASCVRSTGATTGVFQADELEEFVRSHELSIERV